MHNRDFRAIEKGVALLSIDGVQGGELAILRKEAGHMAIESHLAELEKRHQALEAEISDALNHPSTDDLQLLELKRRKLLVKDEITRIRQDVFVH